MANIFVTVRKSNISAPVIALTLFAVASGYLMSLVPLILPYYGLDVGMSSWLASTFYAGLLLGTLFVEPILSRYGHRHAFVGCLLGFILSVVALPSLTNIASWLAARFLAGYAEAGLFVIVESWLLHGDETTRAKRLGVYMAALYGGTSIGQFGISLFATSGVVPFLTILVILLISIVVIMFGHCQQPEKQVSSPLSLKRIGQLSQPALIGSLVSGLTISAVYGLMPLELLNIGLQHEYIGSLMGLFIIGGVMVQPIVPWLSKSLSHIVLMVVFCLFGSVAIAAGLVGQGVGVLSISLFALGMAMFALYPIAINLGCTKLEPDAIVPATQVMLFVYSAGSIVGPLIAEMFMREEHGLLGYLLATLVVTCGYMLLAKARNRYVVT
ncbi:MFS transporter [Vibrio sp. S4M6]|uniref:MFS transporter n=1 Tax=Vibrio sinus TaxID=2946865 RepID=UPI002029CF6A|nr:MFS transporter [Vibrio sinus]MCL9779925.1 MFS transporter [Vibrio sinus]